MRGQPAAAGHGRSVHLGPPADTRRPLYTDAAAITTIATTGSLGYSDYNALQMSVASGSSHGLDFLASYTLGEAKQQQPRLLRVG